MLVPVPPKARKRSRRIPPPHPVQGPVILDASFEDGTLTLDFDRDVSLAHFTAATIVVNDPGSSLIFVGVSAVVAAGATVVVTTTDTGPSSGTQTTLTAAANNGIAAVSGGGTWAGVVNLVLPYP